MGGSGHTLVYGLRAFHAARPSRWRFRGWRAATEPGGHAAERAYNRRAAFLGDATQTSRSVSTCRSRRYRGCSTGTAQECALGQSRAACRETGTSDDGTPRGETSANSGASAELRSAGHDAIGNARTEDAEAKERQGTKHERHGIIDGRLIATESRCELRKQR